MEHKIIVSESALRELILATAESYALRKDKYGQGLEIYGNIWGHQIRYDDEMIHRVESISVSAAAKGSNHSVVPHPRSLELKNAIVQNCYPYLNCLGDFHSHPYDDLDQVKRSSGWQFSHEDFESMRCNDALWHLSGDNPLMLVMTICKLDRIRESIFEWKTSNTQRFDIGEYRFWLSAAVGFIHPADEDDSRTITANNDPMVHLNLFPMGYNHPDHRLG